MGKKGIQLENFERDFGAAMAMEQGEDNDLEETMLGTDLGGDNNNAQTTASYTAAQQRVVIPSVSSTCMAISTVMLLTSVSEK